MSNNNDKAKALIAAAPALILRLLTREEVDNIICFHVNISTGERHQILNALFGKETKA